MVADRVAGLRLPERETPFVVPWPTPGVSSGFLSFDDGDAWREFVLALDLDSRIPLIVRAKFARALLLLYLSWIDLDLIKAAELVAMTTLELALKDRFPGPGKPPAFGKLLQLLVERDGLADVHIRMIARCGGSAVGRITGKVQPSLSAIRNSLAHGDPFDGLPYAGLVELTRDLIAFAYRDYLAEADRIGVADGWLA